MTSRKPAKAVDPAKQAQAQETIQGLLKGLGNRQPQYMPVGKALEAIGLTPKIMDITIADDPVECLVVPMEELIFKEWKHMGGGFNVASDEQENA